MIRAGLGESTHVIRLGDGLMAAKVRNMTFVTRYTSDVARTGALLLDIKLIQLGGIFMLMTLAVYALASVAVRDLILAAPAVRGWIERAFGAILIGFAAKLALTDR